MGFLNVLKKIIDTLQEESYKKNNYLSYTIETDSNEERNKEEVPKEIKEEYRKTLFLYSESRTTKVKKNEGYKSYVRYECGITNPSIYHKKMIYEGYYEEATAKDVLELLKVPELKNILTANNISAKGKKEELIKQILENVPEDKILTTEEKYYRLSDKGKRLLELNVNFIELHHSHSYSISLEDYYKATKNDSYRRKFNDIAWQIFNERTLLYQSKRDYISERYNFFHMANLLKGENRKEEALLYYLYCLVIDLSGVESIHNINSYKERIETKAEFLKSLEYTHLIPSLIDEIINLKDYYDETMLIEAYNQNYYLPFNVSSMEFLKDLLNNAFNESVFDKEKYNKILIANKKKKYLEMV